MTNISAIKWTRTFPGKNQSRVNLLEINKQNDHLQNLATTLKKIPKDDVVFLFTKNDPLFEKVLRNQYLVLKYGLSIRNMVSIH